MKKNMFMRLAMALVLLVLVTTSAVGGTYAKYVTNDTAKDKARVAKFGVVVEAEGLENLFVDEYAKDDASFSLDANTVVGNEDVFAPGTAGNIAGISVTGQPEVAVRVTYNATATFNGWAVEGDDFYCPLVITVKYTGLADKVFNCEGYTQASVLKQDIEDYINDLTKDYKANEDLTAVSDDLAISWQWDYSTSEANDIKDTDLGDQAADGTNSTFQLDLNVTVTQID